MIYLSRHKYINKYNLENVRSQNPIWNRYTIICLLLGGNPLPFKCMHGICLLEIALNWRQVLKMLGNVGKVSCPGTQQQM